MLVAAPTYCASVPCRLTICSHVTMSQVCQIPNLNSLGLVMEQCHTSLRQKIEKCRENGQSFAEFYLWDFLVDACNALGFMHGQGYFHTVLKPENIFFQGKKSILFTLILSCFLFTLPVGLQLRIDDFGLAKFQDNIKHIIQENPTYAAPEVLEGKCYNHKSVSVTFLACSLVSGLVFFRKDSPGDDESCSFWQLFIRFAYNCSIDDS